MTAMSTDKYRGKLPLIAIGAAKENEMEIFKMVTLTSHAKY